MCQPAGRGSSATIRPQTQQKGDRNSEGVKNKKRVVMPARILMTAVPGIVLVFCPLNAKADEGGATGEGAGCDVVQDGPTLTITGSCITRAPWMQGTELDLDGVIRGELGSETLHLVSGKVMAHNLGKQRALKIAVDGSEYSLLVDPQEVVEVQIKDADQVACYSHSGDTTLQVSYLTEQIRLKAGQGRTVVLSQPEGEVACGMAVRSTYPRMGLPNDELVVPAQSAGGWLILMPSIVLLMALRRQRRPMRNT